MLANLLQLFYSFIHKIKILIRAHIYYLHHKSATDIHAVRRISGILATVSVNKIFCMLKSNESTGKFYYYNFVTLPYTSELTQAKETTP